MELTVREAHKKDVDQLVDYFLKADHAYLKGMGADPDKLPPKEKWMNLLESELGKEYEEKSFYYLIWEADGQAIGHNNINKIVYGKEAFMHLHIWEQKHRQMGLGFQLLKKSLPHFFNNFKIRELICEPYSLNPAPHKSLLKARFELIKKYETTPGWINYYQEVTRYCLTEKKFYNS